MQDLIEKVYSHLIISYYRRLFKYKDKEISKLSATEISMLEIIYHLKNPTYSELAEFMSISQPNLTYRINNLIKKGYVKSIIDENDRRKYYLIVTEKFHALYGASDEIFSIIISLLESMKTQERKVIEQVLKNILQEIDRR